ncbi:MAG: DUF485 domain-containing protein [Corynebacterium sp.]|nr:DUF485 domain-containing protein [Corynebacterium sp.]
MPSTGTAPPRRRQPTAEEFKAMQKSPQFMELRGTYRRFAFPMTLAFMVWYLSYVVLGVFAPNLMSIEVFPGWNVALIFGLLQFLTTFLITWIYVRYANKNIEPRSAAIRSELEGE